MTRRHLQLLLGVLGLLPCLACLDSPSEGERTSTGACPAGEVCSTTTSGLFFVGTFDEGDGGPRHIGSIVVGGIERAQLRAGADRDTASAFAGDVRVLSDTPEVLTVDDAHDGTAVLHGVAPGTAFLRVVENGSGHLVDRVAVNVIDFEGAAPMVTAFDSLVQSGSLLGGHYTGRFAMLAGQRLETHLTLDGGVTDCGVDAALRVTDASGTVVVDGSAGAPYALTLDASGPQSIALRVHAAGVDGEIDVPVVSGIDGVQISSHTVTNAASGMRTTLVCAVGTAGGLPVLGASAPTLSSSSAALSLATSTGALCASVSLASGQRATVVAELDGRSASLDLVGPL